MQTPLVTYRPDIDGLRAIAILAVVGYHVFPNLVPGGFVGVDIFFVISGYLISRNIDGDIAANVFSVKNFYTRRIRRLFPALALVLSASLGAGWLLLFADEFQQLGKHVFSGAAFISNLVLWREAGYFDTASAFKPLLNLWSLGIEEQFYLVWPLVLLGTHRHSLAAQQWLRVVLAMASLVFCVSIATSDPVQSFYSPLSRLWELIAGALIALRVGDDRPWHLPWLRNLAATCGIAGILLATFTFDEQLTYPGWWAILPVFCTCLCIVTGPHRGLGASVLSGRFMVWIGLISYPLYLWHWPLLSFAKIAQSGHLSVGLRLMVVAVSVVLAALTYHLVEKPLRRANYPWSARVLVALIACIGVCGWGVYASNGFVARTANRTVQFDLEKQGNDRILAARAGHCHMHLENQTFSDYARDIDDCLALRANAKNYLVLGDSHAFDLWIALSHGYPTINFLQLTGSGCTPVESLHLAPQSRCGRMIKYAKHQLIGTKTIDGIVLAAKWNQQYTQIARDIEDYRRLGIPVAVFGPTFEFTADVPKILQRIRHEETDQVLKLHLVKERYALDSSMHSFFNKQGVPYISRIEALCKGDDCPVLDEDGRLLVFDTAHWNLDGARHFGAIFAKQGVLQKVFQPTPSN